MGIKARVLTIVMVLMALCITKVTRVLPMEMVTEALLLLKWQGHSLL